MVKVYKLVTHFSTFKFQAGSMNIAANVIHRSVKTNNNKNKQQNKTKTEKKKRRNKNNNRKQRHADQQIYTQK